MRILRNIASIAVIAVLLSPAGYAAVDTAQVERNFELKDGSMVYIFKNGKMGMEDRHGQPARMKPGVIMETKDGRKLIMVGDEVMAVESLKRRESTR